MLFGVTVILYFLKILSGSRNYWDTTLSNDVSSVSVSAMDVSSLVAASHTITSDILWISPDALDVDGCGSELSHFKT
jgi:hypothetical protein